MSWLMNKMIKDKAGRISLYQVAVVSVGGVLFLATALWFGIKAVQSATSTFSQTSWSGGTPTTPGDCTTAAGNWTGSECLATTPSYTGYSAVDPAMVAGTDLKIQSTDYATTHDTDTDFNAADNVKTNTAVSGTGSGAMTLLVLMAIGAMIGSGMFVLAWDVDDTPGKIDNDPGFLEKIEPQEAFDRTLRGKIVTDDLQIFDLNSEGPEFGDGDQRDVFNATSRRYLNSAPRAYGVASYGNGGFNGDDSVRGSGIHGHLQRKLNSLVCYFRVAENNGLPGVEFELDHRLKGGRVAFGERVFGIFYQQLLNLRRLKQDLVDVLPVGAVGDNFSGNRSRRCFIEFVDGNQEPFAVKSLLHCFDFFGLHIGHLDLKGNMAGQGCQAEYEDIPKHTPGVSEGIEANI